MVLVRRTRGRAVSARISVWSIHIYILTPYCRFERWCLSLSEQSTTTAYLPPIDVLLVWHAYLLNPGFAFHKM